MLMKGTYTKCDGWVSGSHVAMNLTMIKMRWKDKNYG